MLQGMPEPWLQSLWVKLQLLDCKLEAELSLSMETEALKVGDRIITEDPAHPDGSFFYLTLISSSMNFVTFVSLNYINRRATNFFCS